MTYVRWWRNPGCALGAAVTVARLSGDGSAPGDRRAGGSRRRDANRAAGADSTVALSWRRRRQLLDSLNARNGQTLRELCADLDMARQSVSKHLAVLEAANLVTTAWRGREKLHYLNAEPINAIAERWIGQGWPGVIANLKTLLETGETLPLPA